MIRDRDWSFKLLLPLWEVVVTCGCIDRGGLRDFLSKSTNTKSKSITAWTDHDAWQVFENVCIILVWAGLWMGSWRGNLHTSYFTANGPDTRNWGSVRLDGDEGWE